METELERVYTWVIDNIPEKSQEVVSDPFSSGGTEWFITAFNSGDNMTLCLAVCDNVTWRDGWKLKAKYYLVVFDEAYKELCRSPETTCYNFCKELYYSTFHDMFSVNVLQQQGKRVTDNKIIIKVYMNVFEVYQGKSAEVEVDMGHCSGFNVLPSLANAVSQIFLEHPDIIKVEDFRPKNDVVKTAYMLSLLGLIKTLNKPPERLSDTDLSKAHRMLSELTEAGFKLDWLVTKLEDAWKTKSQLPNLLLDQIKNLELACSNLRNELMTAADKKI